MTFRTDENKCICSYQGSEAASGVRSPEAPINNHSHTWDSLHCTHGLTGFQIDPLWGNHRIILCTTLKCAPGHVLVLGVDSVIKVHNRMAIMAISLHGLIPRIMHQPVGPVSDREEGCRWSGECRWLKLREPLWREGARYANISSFCVPYSFYCSGSKMNPFSVTKMEPTRPQNQHVLATFINYKSILGSGNPGHNISMVTIWKGQGSLNDFIAFQLLRKIYGLALEHFRWQAFTTLHHLGCAEAGVG